MSMHVLHGCKGWLIRRSLQRPACGVRHSAVTGLHVPEQEHTVLGQQATRQRRHSSHRHCRAHVCAAKPAEQEESAGGIPWPSVLGLLAWAGFAGYALLLSPNQTPTLDMYYLKKLSGLAGNDGFVVNPIFEQLFFLLGVWPAVYASLLIPSGRSGNKVPAWPFVSFSFGLGYFALGPYFAAWTPSEDRDVLTVSPDQEERTLARYARKGLESPLTGVLLLVSLGVLIGKAATAGGQAWLSYFTMFDESRFVHVSSLDFVVLTLLAPFWVLNDASVRQWGDRRAFPVELLAYFPLFGPALYLVLRPKL